MNRYAVTYIMDQTWHVYPLANPERYTDEVVARDTEHARGLVANANPATINVKKVVAL